MKMDESDLKAFIYLSFYLGTAVRIPILRAHSEPISLETVEIVRVRFVTSFVALLESIQDLFRGA